jgi:L-lactate permease
VAGAQHGGLEKDIRVFPALLVCGLSFAAMQFYWSNFLETGLVDIASAIFSLLVMVASCVSGSPRMFWNYTRTTRKPKSVTIRWVSFLRDGLRSSWHPSLFSFQACQR